jgi:hypothetical protein
MHCHSSHPITRLRAATMGQGMAQLEPTTNFSMILTDQHSSMVQYVQQKIPTRLEKLPSPEKISAQQGRAVGMHPLRSWGSRRELLSSKRLIERVTAQNPTRVPSLKDLTQQLGVSTSRVFPGALLYSKKLSVQRAYSKRILGLPSLTPVALMAWIEEIRARPTLHSPPDSRVGLSPNLQKQTMGRQDTSGFITPGILMPMINEAIEDFMTSRMNQPKATGVSGHDLIGLDPLDGMPFGLIDKPVLCRSRVDFQSTSDTHGPKARQDFYTYD